MKNAYFSFIATQHGLVFLIRQVHQMDAGICHVFAVEELTAWRAGAPDGDAGSVVLFGFVEFADQRGDDVAVFGW